MVVHAFKHELAVLASLEMVRASAQCHKSTRAVAIAWALPWESFQARHFEESLLIGTSCLASTSALCSIFEAAIKERPANAALVSSGGRRHTIPLKTASLPRDVALLLLRLWLMWK